MEGKTSQRSDKQSRSIGGKNEELIGLQNFKPFTLKGRTRAFGGDLKDNIKMSLISKETGSTDVDWINLARQGLVADRYKLSNGTSNSVR